MHKCLKCNQEFKSFLSLRSHKANCGKWTFEQLKDIRAKKIALIKERGHICEICKLTSWQEKTIPLEIDHIDGDPSNENKSNFRLVCPNCHAQTPTYRGKNIGRHKGTKRQEIQARYPDYRKLIKLNSIP